jgi:chemotaxis signal transduction protein
MSAHLDILRGIQSLLFFYIGENLFCADMGRISTTIKAADAVISSKENFSDWISYNGRLFRALNIKEILHIPANGFTSNNRIVLCEAAEKLFAFSADKIIEIVTLDSSFEEKYVNVTPSSKHEFILGEVVFQEMRASLIDLDALSREMDTFSRFDLKIEQLKKKDFDTHRN